MSLSVRFLRIFRVELCNYTASDLLARYTAVLRGELAGRHRFYFPANRSHRNQRRQGMRDLIHDLRLLKLMTNNAGVIQDGLKPYIEGAADPKAIIG